MVTSTDGPDAPRGPSSPLLGAQNTMPVVPPLPADPNSCDVTLNISPGSSLPPAAGSGPDPAGSNDPVVVLSVESVRPTCGVQINNLVDMQIKGVDVPNPAVPNSCDVTLNISPGPSLPPAAGSGPDPAGSNNPVLVRSAESVRPTCEVQINNLVDMQIKKGDDRKKLVALEALKEWKEAESGLEGKVERRTKQTDKLIYEIYQLVGLYSVFVGVVFTAALQSSNLKCQHIWSPVLLCVVAWLIIILVTRKRLKRYKALRITIKSEDKARSEIYGQISKLKSYGHEGFDFAKDATEKFSESTVRQFTEPKSTCGIRITASRVIPIVLTSFTLILVGSFVHILCLKDITSRLH